MMTANAAAIEARRDAVYDLLMARRDLPLATWGTLKDYMEQLSDDLQAALIGEPPDTDSRDCLCPDCNGIAYIEGPITFMGSYDMAAEYDPIDCPSCNGTGTLDDTNSRPVILGDYVTMWEEGHA